MLLGDGEVVGTYRHLAISPDTHWWGEGWSWEQGTFCEVDWVPIILEKLYLPYCWNVYQVCR